jgi:hypothetical protein
MAEERNHRIDHALSSLIETFLRAGPDEDQEAYHERHDAALDRAQQIIDRLSSLKTEHIEFCWRCPVNKMGGLIVTLARDGCATYC